MAECLFFTSSLNVCHESKTNQQQLRDTIAHERRIEPPFENQRWPGLVRTGQAIVVMPPYGSLQWSWYIEYKQHLIILRRNYAKSFTGLASGFDVPTIGNSFAPVCQ